MTEGKKVFDAWYSFLLQACECVSMLETDREEERDRDIERQTYIFIYKTVTFIHL